MTYIGIDPGVQTGFAVWHSESRYLAEVETYSITQAMERVKMLADILGKDNIRVFVEDARKRKWFGNSGREKLQGAGSVKRDSRIWEDWCREQGLQYRMIAPGCNRTKLTEAQFKFVTQWHGRSSVHGRDAAMLVFGR